MIQEISRIGTDETSSGDAVQALSADGDHADGSGFSEEDKKVKEIEDYPRPFAVAGASVL